MNAQEAFDIIADGLIEQNDVSKNYIVDNDGHLDAIGFIFKDLDKLDSQDIYFDRLAKLWISSLKGMTIYQLNESSLDKELDQEACHVVELCQQIHDTVTIEEWAYHLRKTAESEGLKFSMSSEYEQDVPTKWSDLF